MPISDVNAFLKSLGETALKAEIQSLLQAEKFAQVVQRAELAGFRFTVEELKAHNFAEFFQGIAYAAKTVGNEVVKEADTVGDEIVHAAVSAEKWVVGAANTVGNEVVDIAKKAGDALNPTHW